jgi:hypothetical protein
LMEVTL